MLRTESEHDSYGAGHAGTALSAALGMATARDLRGGKEHVVALCGDAAFTCGITYEALNNISDHTKRLVVILNDNEWSIDKNVGAIAKHLTNIVTNPRYENLHRSMEKLVERFTGETGKNLALKAEGAVKGLLSTGHRPSLIFEEMGLSYYGPIDGHDLPNADPHARFRQAPRAPGAPARHHAEEQGLRDRHVEAEEVSRRRPRHLRPGEERRDDVLRARRPTRRSSPRR